MQGQRRGGKTGAENNTFDLNRAQCRKPMRFAQVQMARSILSFWTMRCAAHAVCARRSSRSVPRPACDAQLARIPDHFGIDGRAGNLVPIASSAACQKVKVDKNCRYSGRYPIENFVNQCAASATLCEPWLRRCATPGSRIRRNPDVGFKLCHGGAELGCHRCFRRCSCCASISGELVHLGKRGPAQRFAREMICDCRRIRPNGRWRRSRSRTLGLVPSLQGCCQMHRTLIFRPRLFHFPHDNMRHCVLSFHSPFCRATLGKTSYATHGAF